MGGKLKHEKVKFTCLVCGEKVIKYYHIRHANKFCSRKCYFLYRNPLGKAEIICKVCGKKKKVKRSEFERGQHKYCSWECYKVEHPGISNRRNGSSYRRLRKAFKRDNEICLICGNKAKDVHHIIPFREFENDKEADKITNLISLCKRCHRKTFGKEFRFVEQFRDILKEEYGYE
jgi:5-methylcytosine-specific restriction endonuclease McrA